MPEQSTGIEIRRPSPAALAVQDFDRSKVALIKQTLMPGATDGELELFVEYARRTGLDPFTRQIHAIKVWDKETGRYKYAFVTGVDGFRLTAMRTGEWEGSIGPLYKAQGGEWTDSWEEATPPYAAKFGVRRTGHDEPTWAIIRYADFVQRNRQGQPRGNWASQPTWMMGIRAECHAYRKAFPRELAGLRVDYGPGNTSSQIIEPDRPVTAPQKQKLGILAGELGWDDDERHARAGVESFNDLRKGRAHELITEWQAIRDGEIEDGEIVDDSRTAEEGPGMDPISPPEQDPEAEGDPGRGPSDSAASADVEAESEEGASAGRRLPPDPSASTESSASGGSRAGKARSEDTEQPEPEAVEGDPAGVEPAESNTLDGPATDEQWKRAQTVWKLADRRSVLGKYVREFNPEQAMGVDDVTGRMLEALITKKIGPSQPEST